MAFRATLEEVLNADIILHVRDVSNPDTGAQKSDVLEVLESLGLKDIKYSEKYLEVLNKADLLSAEDSVYWQNKTATEESKVLISALSGQGQDELLKKIEQKLVSAHPVYEVSVPVSEGKISAWLYQNCAVSAVENDENRNIYTVNISYADLARLKRITEENHFITVRKI